MPRRNPRQNQRYKDAKKAKIKQNAAKSERGFRPSPRKTRIRIRIRKWKIKTTIRKKTRIRNATTIRKGTPQTTISNNTIAETRTRNATVKTTIR